LSRSSSRRSIGARVRSLSPFKKPDAAEHGVVLRTHSSHRVVELTCESKAQAGQWLSALRVATAKGADLRSSNCAASQVEFSPPHREPALSPKPAEEDRVEELIQKTEEAQQQELRTLAGRASPTAGSRPCTAALVMEDLDDGHLTQLCSPKRPPQEPLLPSEGESPKKSSQCDLALDAPGKTPKSSAKVEEEATEVAKMFDKRELRRRNRPAFEKQLLAWREKHQELTKAGPVGLDSQRVRIFVRKRPLFPNEEGEFDVLTVRGPGLVVHNCLTKADLRSLFIGHMLFHYARVFDETADDAEVYQRCGEPAVQHALQGKSATIFMFGQTGSGKTHTMQALLQKVSEQLCGEGGLDKICLGAFEIAGKTMRDLQDPENPKKELKAMVDANADMLPGQLEDERSRVSTKIHGLRWCSAQSSTELLQLVTEAQERRATRATQANAVSSRSHSVLRIGRTEDDVRLTLVDCAGSERNEDTTHHTAQDRKDAADINSTIFALKECFRTMRSADGQRPPFRDSLLTRVLADSLTSDDAMVVAIGTVSPSSKDTEHSIETLKSLQLLQGTQMTYEKREDIKDQDSAFKHPRTWSEEQVREWFGKAAEGQGEPWVSSLPKGTDGKLFVRWTNKRFAQVCGGDSELGDAIFKHLHQEMHNVDQAKRRKV